MEAYSSFHCRINTYPVMRSGTRESGDRSLEYDVYRMLTSLRGAVRCNFESRSLLNWKLGSESLP